MTDAFPQRRKAPWPDFAGNDIHEGDTIRHPSGEEGKIVFLEFESDPGDQWRVLYDDGDRKPVPPHLKKVPYNTKLPQWLRDWLTDPAREKSGPVLIEVALREAYNLNPPIEAQGD